MKKSTHILNILSVGLVLICLINNESTAQSSNGPEFDYKAENNLIQLDTMYLNDMDDEVKLDIEFENKGNQPLIVNKVSGCCGTQIKDWTKQPVKPGEKGTIKVQFRVKPSPHKISRNVKTVSNDPEGTKTLKIKGIVTKRNDGSLQLE